MLLYSTNQQLLSVAFLKLGVAYLTLKVAAKN